MSTRASSLQLPRASIAFGLGVLLALLVLALAAAPASATHPYSGAPIVYVGLEQELTPEEGFTGFTPVGLRSIRLGEPRLSARALTSDPSDSDPAVSPDGRLIAFSRSVGPEGDRTRVIMVMRRDGSRLHSLTGGWPGCGDGEPSFTPSGKRIHFVRACTGSIGSNQGDILSIGTDGQDLRQVTSARHVDGSPVFSPNGRQIVFSREPVRLGTGGELEWGLRHVYSIRPDGTHARDLTPRIPARTRRSERNFTVEDPAFSPNGRVIAFTVNGGNGVQNIYTMRPNGRRKRSLTNVGERPLSRRFQLSEPAFSPSGRFLVVTARDRGHAEFAVIDLTDRSELLGTGSALQGEAAAWLPHPRSSLSLASE